jgi:hypothetical protein
MLCIVFFASESRPILEYAKKDKKGRNGGGHGCAHARACVGSGYVKKSHDVLFQDDVERGGQQCAQKWAHPVL